MNPIVIIDVDLDHGSLGLRSYLAEKLAGTVVLRRTVQRVSQATAAGRIFALAPQSQQHDVKQLLAELPIEVMVAEPPVAPWHRSMQLTRKWSLTGWRGGISGSTIFDEHINPAAACAVAKAARADTIVSIHAASVLVDPAIITQLLAHHESVSGEMRMTITQAAPGLCGAVYRLDLLDDLARSHMPPGMLFAYNPDTPRADPIANTCNLNLDARLTQSPHRYLADTRRSFEFLEHLVDNVAPDVDALGVVQQAEFVVGETTFPCEIDLEVTARSQRADVLRPTGRAQELRGDMRLHDFAAICRQAAQFDDVTITLGGSGEPTLHENLADMVRTAKEAGVFGMHLVTDGSGLSEQLIADLTSAGLDAVTIKIDAHSEAVYQAVHPGGAYASTSQIIPRWAAQRTKMNNVGPLLIAEMCKARSTFDEMELFFDHWLRNADWAVIREHSDHARQIKSEAVVNMAPPLRGPCRRLQRRMMILSDGTVALCGEDFLGRQSVGSAFETPLEQLWQGPKMQSARKAHDRLTFDELTLCESCSEWHRP